MRAWMEQNLASRDAVDVMELVVAPVLGCNVSVSPVDAHCKLAATLTNTL